MLRKILRATVPALLGGCLLGCVATKLVWKDEGKPYPLRTSAENIHVFIEEPDTVFVKIASLEARTGMANQKAIEKLKKRASELGGDGIILKSIYSDVTYNPSGETSDVYKSEVRYLEATVIRYSP